MVGMAAMGVEVVEDELVARIRGGDADAFRTLVDQHRTWLIARCRRHLGGDSHAAEDVAQECFVALQRTLARSDRPMRVRPWLSVVARNRCIDETRKRRPLPTPVIPDAAVYDAEAGTEDPHLARAWAALNGRHRAVLELRELGGMSYDEIAVALAVTSGAVETLLFRARTALRREYARAGGKVAALGPIEEAVQRATGGQGLLSRLAEQAGARFGDGGAALAAASPHGSSLAGMASNGGSAMSATGPPSWLVDLQARLAASGLLDPLVQQGPAGGRLRVVLAGVGALLATVAVTAPTIDRASPPSPSSSAPPAAAVTVPSAPAESTPAAGAPAAPAPEAPAAPPAPTAEAPPTPPAPPPAAPTAPTPIATTATTVVGTVAQVVQPVTEAVDDAVDGVLDLPRR